MKTLRHQGFMRFLQAQGLRVFEDEGGLWMEKRKFFIENFPPHRRLHLDSSALLRLFRHRCAVVRYTCEENEGQSSFEYLCSGKDFSFQSLSPDARRRVRRGLEMCEIRRVEFDLLARYGCDINRSTLARQGRSGLPRMTDETLWQRYMKACATIPDVEAYGAFADGRFVGFSIGVICDDYCYLHHTQAPAHDLKYSPINALTYFVTKTMLEREDINHVSQGLESFVPLPQVERFKLAMGFQKHTLGRRVVINPLAKPAFSPPVVWLAKQALKTFNRPGLAEDLVTFTKSLRGGDVPQMPTES